jgi:tetratricopeptide (TPR) repeat protein
MQPNEIKANLKKRITEAKELSAHHKRELDKDPEDFGLRLRFNSFKTIAEDLESQLAAHEAFDRGWKFFNKGKRPEAKKEFRKSIELMPSYLGFLNNQLGKNVSPDDKKLMVDFMNFLLEVGPTSQLARRNLVVAYINYGIELAKRGNIIAAIRQFKLSKEVTDNKELTDLINENLAAAYTELGRKADQNRDLEETARDMLIAFSFLENHITRGNAKRALEQLATDYLQKTAFKKAIEIFEKLEQLFGLLPELKNDYAIALACLNRTEEGVTVLKTLLQNKSNLSEDILNCVQDNLATMEQQYKISEQNKTSLKRLSPKISSESNRTNLLLVLNYSSQRTLRFESAAA